MILNYMLLCSAIVFAIKLLIEVMKTERFIVILLLMMVIGIICGDIKDIYDKTESVFSIILTIILAIICAIPCIYEAMREKKKTDNENNADE